MIKNRQARGRARTAEADAGAAAVVDAEEVRVVRPAAAAQEIHHVDPPHLAGGSLIFSRLVRVHDAALLLLGGIAVVVDGGDNERDNPREQEDTTKLKPRACDPAPAADLPLLYLNRPRQSRCKQTSRFLFARGQGGRRGRPAGRARKD